VFFETNGSYPFTVARVQGYSVRPTAGIVTVGGADSTVEVDLTNHGWIVGTVDPGTASLFLVDGAFNLSVLASTPTADHMNYTLAATAPGYVAATAAVTVTPGNTTSAVGLTLIPVGYEVTFRETGLPSGTPWSVALNETPELGTGDLRFPAMANGTYSFDVRSIAGYSASPSLGTIDVSGANVTKTIAFQALPSSGSTFLGLPVLEGYAVVGVVIIAILVVTAILVLMRRRGRRTPVEPAKPDAGDPPASP
jgi:hypothetical protein